MSATSMSARLAFLDIGPDDRAALRDLRPLIAEGLPAVLDAFYQHIRSWPDYRRVFPDEAVIPAAKTRQLEHWMTLAGGEFAEAYEQSVERTGRARAELGLETRWYVAGYAFIAKGLMALIAKAHAPGALGRPAALERQKRLADALIKAIMLDMDCALTLYLEESERKRRQAVHGVAESFEAEVSGVVEAVAAASTEMSHTARAMASTAEAAADRSAAVATAAEQATSNVSVVASSADEMGRSVQEIAKRVSHSTAIAAHAVERADATNQTIERLSKAAEKIGAVVSLISDIAEQTNLLALNATIESARAGEAGKGFAVVAAEVKSLATQTAKATEDIGAQIQEMQAITRQSVEAIGAIRATISEINQVSVSINAAVEEQAAATREIARSTQEAASGAQEVSANIADVLTGAQEAGSASGEVVAASDELGKQAERLRQEVERFLASIRAA
jgi:methyl-accepting chemotaxis protein